MYGSIVNGAWRTTEGTVGAIAGALGGGAPGGAVFSGAVFNNPIFNGGGGGAPLPGGSTKPSGSQVAAGVLGTLVPAFVR